MTDETQLWLLVVVGFVGPPVAAVLTLLYSSRHSGGTPILRAVLIGLALGIAGGGVTSAAVVALLFAVRAIVR